MSRYKMIVEYDGGDYRGFQRQVGLPTVQEEIEKALSIRLQENITIHASGRTDAGVHAIGQTVHFDTDKEIQTQDFGFRINTLLPENIAIKSCEKVNDDFHSQYNAKRKTYLYKICMSKVHSPLKRKYYYVCGYSLDIDKMRKASEYLIGEHDFRSFMLSDTEKDNTVRTIYDLRIEKVDDETLHFYVCGNGFLHNMVRVIVGTLVDIGRGRFSAEYMKTVLDAKDRSKAGKTVASCGLYLLSVEY